MWQSRESPHDVNAVLTILMQNKKSLIDERSVVQWEEDAYSHCGRCKCLSSVGCLAWPPGHELVIRCIQKTFAVVSFSEPETGKEYIPCMSFLPAAVVCGKWKRKYPGSVRIWGPFQPPDLYQVAGRVYQIYRPISFSQYVRTTYRKILVTHPTRPTHQWGPDMAGDIPHIRSCILRCNLINEYPMVQI